MYLSLELVERFLEYIFIVLRFWREGPSQLPRFSLSLLLSRDLVNRVHHHVRQLHIHCLHLALLIRLLPIRRGDNTLIGNTQSILLVLRCLLHSSVAGHVLEYVPIAS